ncbi:helix-turn-helix domain-containing protein [Streptacidiphilus sp. N1-12]|uniref:Helix-turn-helix domain-containing protein n=2 Tax=Streptacidiphilus alkalitolerans TaxID=3342712 RepID=A0ABV6V7E5_9ACTN
MKPTSAVTPAPAPEPGLRIVDDIETLKALADPVRVTILQLMMGRTGRGLRGWTAKELAAELGEPQTKLYRHIKHLEERGLLRVAETRQVSGITEQRYVAAQADLQLSRDLLGRPDHADDAAAAFGAAIGSYRDRFLTASRTGRIENNAEAPPEESYRRPLMVLGDVRLPAERAVEFRDRLAGLVDEFLEGPDQEEGVLLNVLLAVYSESESATG